MDGLLPECEITQQSFDYNFYNVWHKIIDKRSSQKYIQSFENWKALGYYYKCTTQNVFCILIFQWLKFWKNKLRIVEPHFFFRINKYLAKICWTLVIGIVSKNTSFPPQPCHRTMETPIPLYIDTHHCTIPNGWCVEMNH
jgi:hypothetical protein